MLSLATDKTVWEAVLANQKIQEFRHTLLEVEGTSSISLLENSLSSPEILRGQSAVPQNLTQFINH